MEKVGRSPGRIVEIRWLQGKIEMRKVFGRILEGQIRTHKEKTFLSLLYAWVEDVLQLLLILLQVLLTL